MLSGKIQGIYELKINETKRIYLCSVKDTADSLKINYYVITSDKDHEPLILQIANTIDLITSSRFSVIKIDKSSNLYKNLVDYIHTANGIKVYAEKYQTIMEELITEKKIKVNQSLNDTENLKEKSLLKK